MSPLVHRTWMVRRWQAAIAVCFVGVAGGLWLIGRRDIRTRRVRYQGQLCTEYFDTKDGLEVRAECPSHGGEWYDDTSEARTYPRGFKVTVRDQPSNDR